jgi:hypothetical protein
MQSEIEDKNPDDILWGAEEIGREVDLDTRAAFYALERGYLPASKIGRKWVTTRGRLLKKFSA